MSSPPVSVDDFHKDALSAEVNEIRAQFFGSGEMKSSSVGSNAEKRARIITALVDTGLKFCVLVVDKGSINAESGLQYRQSFIKYIQGRLYK